MPNKAPRPCTHSGCCILVKNGKCPKHQEQAKERKRKEQNRDPMRPFYKCVRWTKLRIVMLSRFPICTKCWMAAASVVHHIIDARVWCNRGNDFYDESNLTCWCVECHNAHTASQQTHD